VTGVGLLSSVGIGTEETWEAVKADHSGVDRITAFDASAYNSQIAGEVKNFDPTQFIEKKEVKKMGRFIQFAIAAADFALKDSGLQVTPEYAEEVGVYIGSGIGGFEVIEREHQTLLEHGPRMLNRGGRLGVISFQSMEDRLVKQAFRRAEETGVVKLVTKKPVGPSEEEVNRNPRSRSAKLRVVEKC